MRINKGLLPAIHCGASVVWLLLFLMLRIINDPSRYAWCNENGWPEGLRDCFNLGIEHFAIDAFSFLLFCASMSFAILTIVECVKQLKAVPKDKPKDALQGKKLQKRIILIVLFVVILVPLLIALLLDISKYGGLGGYIFEKSFSGPPVSEYQNYLENKYGKDEDFLYIDHSVSCVGFDCTRTFTARRNKRFKVEYRDGVFTDQYLTKG